MNQPSFRDVEMLSAYLDGQLSQVDSTRLETRIKADPTLRSVYDDLRQSRSVLRKLPARRAPRNFTLTPKMAGLRPPLPQAFPFFRLAAAVSTILLFFSFAVNLSVPAVAGLHAAALPSGAYGYGGGGAPVAGQPSIDAAVAPAATQAPAPAATQGPAAMAAAGTDTPQAVQRAATSLATATPDAFSPGAQPKVNPAAQNNNRVLDANPLLTQPVTLPVRPLWLFGLLALALISGGAALLVNTTVEQNWRKANGLQPGRLTSRQWLLLGLAALVILLLAAGIYWMSTTTFYAPVSKALTFPAGPVGDAKGAPPITTAQDIHLSPGLGYSFSASDAAGLMTSIDFPANAVTQETSLNYIPGLDTLAPDGIYFANRAFDLFPSPKSLTLQAPIIITMDYDEVVKNTASGRTLLLDWWSGSNWLDAAGTCSPASTYERLPDQNRIRVSVCQLGTFLLVAP